MNSWLLALAIVLPYGLSSWAEKIGTSEDVESPPVANNVSVERKATSCRIPDNGVRHSPVKVYVDQKRQRIFVWVYNDDGSVREYREGPVTTGGGLKIPNGKNRQAPYCAVTPTVERQVIRAIQERDFGPDSGCTPEEKRANSTVFEDYRSSTFSDGAGNPASMRYATRIKAGYFFHAVAREYKDRLGTENLSGGCVRLASVMAAWLQDRIEEYGAIEVTISPAPKVTDPNDRRYCDQEMVRAAIEGQNSKRIPDKYYTGTEGVYDEGRDGIVDFLDGIGQLPAKALNNLTSPFQGR
jgi:hypothetical protein